jgi:hypothetical protein
LMIWIGGRWGGVGWGGWGGGARAPAPQRRSRDMTTDHRAQAAPPGRPGPWSLVFALFGFRVHLGCDEQLRYSARYMHHQVSKLATNNWGYWCTGTQGTGCDLGPRSGTPPLPPRTRTSDLRVPSDRRLAYGGSKQFDGRWPHLLAQKNGCRTWIDCL